MKSSAGFVTVTLLLMVSLGSLPTRRASAQPQQATPAKAAFETDIRLDHHVNLEAKGVPLDQLFSKLSTEDLELRVDTKCAAQRLHLALHDRPLRILLRSIAELLPGYWKPYANGRGYSFYMTNKALAEREEWWRLYMRQHDAALEAQRRYVVERLDEKPQPLQGEQLSENQYAQIVNAHTFYYALLKDMKFSIADHLVDTLMYGTGDMFVSDCSLEEGAVTYRLSELPEACRQAVHKDYLGAFLASQHISESAVALRIANEGRNLTLYYLLPDGREMQSDLSFSLGQAPDAAPLSLKHLGLISVVKKLGKRAPADWKRLATYQEGRVWPNEPPKANLFPRRMFAFGPSRMAERLDWLRDKSHIEFVSDYYDRSGTSLKEEEKTKSPAEPLKVEMDSLAEEQDISWKVGSEGIYLFRNNRWYRDDGLQVPLPLLRQFTTDLMAHPPQKVQEAINDVSGPQELKARMDLEARIVMALSPFQIATGLEWAAVDTHPKKGPSQTVFPFAGFAERIRHERYTALFYASLNDTARIALIEGRLPFGELNADQQRQAVFLKSALMLQPPDKPIWLRLNATPRRAFSLDIPGGSVRGVRLEVVAPPTEGVP